ncbi:MAG: PilT/PilU family type 4a pilus ATPase, partial [Patescibacteria group bacterium]
MAEALTADMKQLLDIAIEKRASDLHVTVGVSPSIRLDGKLNSLTEKGIVTPESSERLLASIMTREQTERFTQRRELDFSFGYQKMRFRTNVFYQKGNVGAALRLIPTSIRSMQELGIPPILERFTEPSQGFVIITGPTGHGKSTSLAALVEHINQVRSDHIITIEDPIEYIFEHKKSIIVQREIGVDTNSFARALRSALREDPNVVLVGEMRDLETIEAALTLAETGHLVFTTLHTNSSSQTADRIVDVFPPHQQEQVRMQLANVLLGVVSQRLLPRIQGGRVLATEIMIANSAVKNTIREGKTHQLP